MRTSVLVVRGCLPSPRSRSGDRRAGRSRRHPGWHSLVGTQTGGKPMEDVLADFGLTIKFPQMDETPLSARASAVVAAGKPTAEIAPPGWKP